MLAAALIGVARWHDASAQAQNAFAEHIAPLTDRATAVERDILQVAISLRDYLLNPDDSQLVQYQHTVDSARESLSALRSAAIEEPGRTPYQELAPLVYAYLLQTQIAAQQRRKGAISARLENALNDARERVAIGVRGFVAGHQEEARLALDRMALARQKVSRALAVGSGGVVIAFVLLAFFIIQAVRKPAHELLRIAQGFESGDWRPALAATTVDRDRAPTETIPRDEMRILRRAFGTAAGALERREQRLIADAQLASAVASSLDLEKIANACAHTMVEHLHALGAILYCYERAHEHLRPLTAYAFDQDATPIRLGEGIAGQAARDRVPIVLRDVSGDTCFVVKLGFAEVRASTVVAVPVLFRAELLGVVLIATVRELDTEDMSFLSSACVKIGLGLNNASNHQRLQRSLAEVQKKNADVEAQNAAPQTLSSAVDAQPRTPDQRSESEPEQQAEKPARARASARCHVATSVRSAPDES